MCFVQPPSHVLRTFCRCLQVRDHLLRVKSKLVLLLKGLAARIPRALLSAASFKASELEKQLKSKPNSIEDVDAQRRYAAAFCGGIAPVCMQSHQPQHCVVIKLGGAVVKDTPGVTCLGRMHICAHPW